VNILWIACGQPPHEMKSVDMWITIHSLSTGLSTATTFMETFTASAFFIYKKDLSTYPQVPTTTTTIYIYINNILSTAGEKLI